MEKKIEEGRRETLRRQKRGGLGERGESGKGRRVEEG